MAPNLSRPSETAPHYKWSPSYSSSSTANDHPRQSKLTTHGRVQFTASKQDPSPQSACPAASPPLNNKANSRRLQTSHPRGIKSLDGSICALIGREVVDYRDVPVKGGLFPDEVAYRLIRGAVTLGNCSTYFRSGMMRSSRSTRSSLGGT